MAFWCIKDLLGGLSACMSLCWLKPSAKCGQGELGESVTLTSTMYLMGLYICSNMLLDFSTHIAHHYQNYIWHQTPTQSPSSPQPTLPSVVIYCVVWINYVTFRSSPCIQSIPKNTALSGRLPRLLDLGTLLTILGGPRFSLSLPISPICSIAIRSRPLSISMEATA